jgi:hypothetical protein
MEETLYDQFAAVSREGEKSRRGLLDLRVSRGTERDMAVRDPKQYLFKASWSGTLGADEIFVYSRWVTNLLDVESGVIEDLDTLVSVMFDFAVTGSSPVATLGPSWPSHVAWTQLKVSPWDPILNKLKAGREPAYAILSDTPGGSTGSGMPYQNSVAVTTRSEIAGRRKYNRFYLPVMVNNVTDGQGLLQPAFADSLSAYFGVEIETTADDAPNQSVFVNYNPGTDNTIPTWAAGCWPIQDVYLGHRVDTIRRRRNEAPEGRSITVIT